MDRIGNDHRSDVYIELMTYTMDFLCLCDSVSRREQEDSHYRLVSSDVSLVHFVKSNFRKVPMRCAYMYKFGGAILHYNFAVFRRAYMDPHVKECVAEVLSRRRRDLKFCSLSSGPGLDVLAFVMAFYRDDGHMLMPDNVEIISRYDKWKDTLKIMLDEAKRTVYTWTLPKSIEREKFGIIQDNVQVALAEKSRVSIAGSSLIFMVRTINLPERDAEREGDLYPKLMDIFESMSEQTIVFGIDTTASLPLFNRVFSQFNGRYLFEPTYFHSRMRWLFSESGMDERQYPASLLQGTFFVWLKVDKENPAQISRSECCSSPRNRTPVSTEDEISRLIIERNEVLRKSHEAAKNVATSLALFLFQLRQLNALLEKRNRVESQLSTSSRNSEEVQEEDVQESYCRSGAQNLQDHKTDHSFPPDVQFISLENGGSSFCAADSIFDIDRGVAQAVNSLLEPGMKAIQNVLSAENSIPMCDGAIRKSIFALGASTMYVEEDRLRETRLENFHENFVNSENQPCAPSKANFFPEVDTDSKKVDVLPMSPKKVPHNEGLKDFRLENFRGTFVFSENHACAPSKTGFFAEVDNGSKIVDVLPISPKKGPHKECLKNFPGFYPSAGTIGHGRRNVSDGRNVSNISSPFEKTESSVIHPEDFRPVSEHALIEEPQTNVTTSFSGAINGARQKLPYQSNLESSNLCSSDMSGKNRDTEYFRPVSACGLIEEPQISVTTSFSGVNNGARQKLPYKSNLQSSNLCTSDMSGKNRDTEYFRPVSACGLIEEPQTSVTTSFSGVNNGARQKLPYQSNLQSSNLCTSDISGKNRDTEYFRPCELIEEPQTSVTTSFSGAINGARQKLPHKSNLQSSNLCTSDMSGKNRDTEYFRPVSACGLIEEPQTSVTTSFSKVNNGARQKLPYKSNIHSPNLCTGDMSFKNRDTSTDFSHLKGVWNPCYQDGSNDSIWNPRYQEVSHNNVLDLRYQESHDSRKSVSFFENKKMDNCHPRDLSCCQNSNFDPSAADSPLGLLSRVDHLLLLNKNSGVETNHSRLYLYGLASCNRDLQTAISNGASGQSNSLFSDFHHQCPTPYSDSGANGCGSSFVDNIKRIWQSPTFEDASSSSKSS